MYIQLPVFTDTIKGYTAVSAIIKKKNISVINLKNIFIDYPPNLLLLYQEVLFLFHKND